MAFFLDFTNYIGNEYNDNNNNKPSDILPKWGLGEEVSFMVELGEGSIV